MTFADIEEAKVDLGPEIDVIGLDQEADLGKEVGKEDQEVLQGDFLQRKDEEDQGCVLEKDSLRVFHPNR